jgi:hypothetical protein
MFLEKNTNRQIAKFRSNLPLALTGFLVLSGLVLIGLKSGENSRGSVLGEITQNEESGNFKIATGTLGQLGATSTLPGFGRGDGLVDAAGLAIVPRAPSRGRPTDALARMAGRLSGAVVSATSDMRTRRAPVAEEREHPYAVVIPRSRNLALAELP